METARTRWRRAGRGEPQTLLPRMRRRTTTVDDGGDALLLLAWRSAVAAAALPGHVAFPRAPGAGLATAASRIMA